MMWEMAGNKIKKLNGKINMGINAKEFIYDELKKKLDC